MTFSSLKTRYFVGNKKAPKLTNAFVIDKNGSNLTTFIYNEHGYRPNCLVYIILNYILVTDIISYMAPSNRISFIFECVCISPVRYCLNFISLLLINFTECYYNYFNLINIKVHIIIHTDVKQFSCSECGYKCYYMLNYILHISVHLDEMPFSCTECDYIHTNYNTHILKHTGEIPTSCTKCDYIYTCFRVILNTLIRKNAISNG